MIRQKAKRIFSIPMWASILLLPCFLAYFLKSEFTNEEKALISAKREKVFESYIPSVKSNSALQLKKDSTNAKWVKDTTATEVSFHISFNKDSLYKTEYKKLKNTFNVFVEDDQDLSEARDIVFEIDSISSTEKVFGHTNELFIEAEKSRKKQKRIAQTNSDSVNYTIIQYIDKANNIHVTTQEVMFRILPQIFFSLLLLISVWLSFYLNAKSIKRERRLTEMRNDFMSNMSHELKTPVSTISVALEALKTFDAANDETLRKEYIEISKSEVDRLGLLVDKALNISLYEQGKFVYNRQIIDLNAEIKRIIKTLKIQLDSQNVKLEFTKTGRHYFVNADKTHITNVIHNLIENGIKYSHKDLQLAIDMHELHDKITISISDNGIGIPKEYQSKIFDKFFRVPKGNTHNVKGHGLGLSYVKEVIESQGGQINVKSELDVGSTFIITLPKIEATE